jgi:hypothetical protein
MITDEKRCKSKPKEPKSFLPLPGQESIVTTRDIYYFNSDLLLGFTRMSMLAHIDIKHAREVGLKVSSAVISLFMGFKLDRIKNNLCLH